MRLALAQLNPLVGDLRGNADRCAHGVPHDVADSDAYGNADFDSRNIQSRRPSLLRRRWR